ncbi:MAG: hypothetical protein AAF830_13180 [Pseudomonadota bacterium]
MIRTFAVLTAAIGFANAGVIDFETAPSSFTSLTQDGATLTAQGGNTIRVSNQNALGGLVALEDAPRTGYRLSFASPVDGTVSADLGDFGQDEDTLRLELFDSSDMLISFDVEVLAAGVTGMLTVSATGMNIAYALFTSGGDFPNTVYIDNITFPSSTAPVPVPAAAPLFAAALAGAGALRRKAKKSA